MITYSDVHSFPNFLKFYDCLEFVEGIQGVWKYELSNISYSWVTGFDEPCKDSNVKKIYLDIMLRFKYCNQLFFLNLSGRFSRIELISQYRINKFNIGGENNLCYEVNKKLIVPEFREILKIKFKNMSFKNITDSLIEERGKELYDKLIIEEIIFNTLKPYTENIKNQQLMFIKKVDFIDDNLNTILSTGCWDYNKNERNNHIS